jgi:hypothetical protein
MTICLIIPCYLAKSQWLGKYLDSIVDKAVDVAILIIATDAAETDGLQRMFAHHPVAANLHFVDISNALQRHGHAATAERIRLDMQQGVINLKKFAGLKYALDAGFDTMLCIDADSKAIASLPVLAAQALQNCAKRVILGARTQKTSLLKINQSAYDLANSSPEVARGPPIDITIYTWFFDIPTYQIADLAAFFQAMGDFDAFMAKVTWTTFEHLVYGYFLLRTGRVNLLNYDTTGVNRESEFLTLDDLTQIDATFNYRPVWLNRRSFDAGGPQSHRVLMLTHTDR